MRLDARQQESVGIFGGRIKLAGVSESSGLSDESGSGDQFTPNSDESAGSGDSGKAASSGGGGGCGVAPTRLDTALLPLGLLVAAALFMRRHRRG